MDKIDEIYSDSQKKEVSHNNNQINKIIQYNKFKKYEFNLIYNKNRKINNEKIENYNNKKQKIIKKTFRKNNIIINYNKNGLNHPKYKILPLTIILSLMILASYYVYAQTPSPFNVEGRVFTDNTQITGVPGGLTVRINNTISGDLIETTTQDPGPPHLRGIYSETILGNEGNLIIVSSWNSTHWGSSNLTLLSSTTTIDVVLNRTRTSEPNITILIPSNNSIRNTTDVFNVTANISILGSDATSCNATISFSNNGANITADQNFTNQLGDITFHQSETTTWNVTGRRDGNLNITVYAQCASDQEILENLNYYTINLSIKDTTAPVINLIRPENNSWVSANFTFEFNVTENTGIQNCSLFFNDKLNQTIENIIPDTLANFTMNTTVEGIHNWSISCFDNSSNLNQGNSSVFYLNIDVTSPQNITLLFPQNNSVMINYSNLFRYNITDNINASNCSLIINNQVVQTNHTITQNISNNFSYTMAGGNYNWSVNCSDNSNNIGFSGYFEFQTPDLKINISDIKFSNNNPVEKETIEINATIYNFGPANTTTNIIVQFWENDPDIDGIQLADNKTINVTSGNNITVSINYTLKIGKTDIFVIIDPPLAINGSIIESNETNNKANRSFDIPPYHIFYGEIISDIFLDTSSNTTVVAWLNATDFGGNIFVADSDSSVSFNSLQALSLNNSNNLTMDDFADLDIALNTTNLTDSINRTYTINGAVRDIDNFTVFGAKIINVSIINSTNTSNFITGILWDTSDYDEIGFYNGSQDVIFVTKINRNSLGFYGTYDYEISVPATLRKYIRPNVQDSISFYREIT